MKIHLDVETIGKVILRRKKGVIGMEIMLICE